VTESRSSRSLEEWLQLLERRHPRTIDLGLERCGEVYRRLGSPRPARRIYVVAGTNGKGSTVANICALLGGLGYRYGSYTSPHLLRYNERIRVGGDQVSDDVLLDAFERVEEARGSVSLTYFEFGTLAAICVLQQADLDFAVMEVGLGGRLDAVNLLDADCAVITPIGLDHQEYLGPDRESIGREKAGIVRRGRPVICTEAEPPRSVLQVAEECGAPLMRRGRHFDISPDGNGARFRRGNVEIRLPPLPGQHQRDNAAAALAAVLELLPKAAAHAEEIGAALATVQESGRLQRISGCPAVWLDVGHNPMAAEAVASALPEQMQAEGIVALRCVLAMLADKDAGGLARALKSIVSRWYCAGLPGERGQGGEALRVRLERVLEPNSLRAFTSVEEALRAALGDLGEGEGVLVIGSFLTVGEALKYWHRINAGAEGGHRGADAPGC
jgi:dihydrofolate synthase/folylpolyglutamate synthase